MLPLWSELHDGYKRQPLAAVIIDPMIALFGSVVVVLSVIIGFKMAGGNLLLLWHPSEIVIITGAALGAFITSNSIKVVKAAFVNALGLIKPARYGRESYVNLLKLIFDLLVKSRKEGPLGGVRG